MRLPEDNRGQEYLDENFCVMYCDECGDEMEEHDYVECDSGFCIGCYTCFECDCGDEEE